MRFRAGLTGSIYTVWNWLIPAGQPALFDFSILSEFRQCLLIGNAEEHLLNHPLMCCQELKWLKAATKQRTESIHVLTRIRATNRLERVIETMRFTLNRLSMLVPDWLAGHLQPEWAKRYGPQADDFRLPHTKAKRLPTTTGG
jgi:transposase